MKKYSTFLLLFIASIITSCSKDDSQNSETYKISFESKVSSNYTQQIKFTQAKGVTSTINNIPGSWSSSTNTPAEFTSGDSVYIQVKATPIAQTQNKDTLVISIKTLNTGEVKFIKQFGKNSDGSMTTGLGVRLK